jgi:hypothetical membrane protein
MDLRKPSGYFFSLLGVVLTLMGIFAPDTGAPLTTIDVNLYVGIAMVLFGIILLLLARRAAG